MKNYNKFLSLLCYGLAFFLIFYVQNSSAREEVLQCPELKTPEVALNLYLKAEVKGARLSSEYLDRTSECFKTDSKIAWDFVKVVDGFSLKNCTPKKQDSCFVVSFKVLGELYSGGELKVHKKAFLETQKMQIKKLGAKWEIEGLKDLPPHVSKEGLVDFLSDPDDDGDPVWKKKIIEELKSKFIGI